LLIGAAAALGTILGLRQLGRLIGVVFLALLLAILVHPVHGWLRGHGVPKPLALGGLLVGMYGLLVLLVVIMIVSVARLATLLPGYADEVGALRESINGWLADFEIGQRARDALTGAVSVDQAAGRLVAALRSVTSFVASAVFLISLLLFMGVESLQTSFRFTPLWVERPHVGQALQGFATNTRRFLAVTAIFGAITGAADALLLWLLHIPEPLLWGLLAFICNFIPYVGFVIGLIPPALLALLGGDWRLMIFIIVVYIILNSLFTTLLQSYFVGNAVGLSITLTVISLVFWAWVIGPLGAILAVPLSLLVKALLIDADPAAGWAEATFGPGPARVPRRLKRSLRRPPEQHADAVDVDPAQGE
jgi:AI-2 transport protein TqsA